MALVTMWMYNRGEISYYFSPLILRPRLQTIVHEDGLLQEFDLDASSISGLISY